MSIAQRMRDSGTYALFCHYLRNVRDNRSQLRHHDQLAIGLNEIAPVVISGAAVTFVMVSGSLDLSVGGILEISGVVAADLSAHRRAVTDLLHRWRRGRRARWLDQRFLVVGLGINAVIATLGTWYVADGIANLVAYNGSAITAVSNSFGTLGEGSAGPIPYSLMVMVAVVIVFIFLERKTLMGKYSVAIGSNIEGSRSPVCASIEFASSCLSLPGRPQDSQVFWSPRGWTPDNPRWARTLSSKSS